MPCSKPWARARAQTSPCFFRVGQSSTATTSTLWQPSLLATWHNSLMFQWFLKHHWTMECLSLRSLGRLFMGLSLGMSLTDIVLTHFRTMGLDQQVLFSRQ